MILTTLVTGTRSADREAAIFATLDPAMATGLILEGLPSGNAPLDTLPDRYAVYIARIAPGCVCCTGNLTMRVTLDRMLRRTPARLYISVASTLHLAQTREFLSAPPYEQLLTLTQELHA